jgi:hypothetical protein
MNGFDENVNVQKRLLGNHQKWMPEIRIPEMGAIGRRRRLWGMNSIHLLLPAANR